jgi:hypothetical protein
MYQHAHDMRTILAFLGASNFLPVVIESVSMGSCGGLLQTPRNRCLDVAQGNRVNVAEAGLSPRVMSGRALTRVLARPVTQDFARIDAESRGWPD